MLGFYIRPERETFLPSLRLTQSSDPRPLSGKVYQCERSRQLLRPHSFLRFLRWRQAARLPPYISRYSGPASARRRPARRSCHRRRQASSARPRRPPTIQSQIVRQSSFEEERFSCHRFSNFFFASPSSIYRLRRPKPAHPHATVRVVGTCWPASVAGARYHARAGWGGTELPGVP